jgi:hypothetical protein
MHAQPILQDSGLGQMEYCRSPLEVVSFAFTSVRASKSWIVSSTRIVFPYMNYI